MCAGDGRYAYAAAPISPEYDAADACAIGQSNVFSLGRLLPEFLDVNCKNVTEFPIPIVMFMGRPDYTTPPEPTDAWLRNVEAPYKQGVWFERSSHMVQWEEPGKTLTSLLQYVRPLATGEGGKGASN